MIRCPILSFRWRIFAAAFGVDTGLLYPAIVQSLATLLAGLSVALAGHRCNIVSPVASAVVSAKKQAQAGPAFCLECRG